MKSPCNKYRRCVYQKIENIQQQKTMFYDQLTPQRQKYQLADFYMFEIMH